MHRALVLALLSIGCGAAPPPATERAEEQAASGPWAEDPETLRLPIPVDVSPGRGAEQPLVTIVIFSDFQCPFCRDAVPLLEQAAAAHPDQIRVYFRHLPLDMHEHARLAAEASEEARAQGGDRAFWSFHDRMFSGEGSLDAEGLIEHASALGLDAERFRVALRGRVHRERVEDDLALANAIGLDGTPVLFVNGRPILGLPEPDDLEEMLDEEIRIAEEAMRRGIARQDLYARLLVDATETLRERMRQAREEEAEPELDLNQVYAVPIDGAPALGPADALVTIVVFSDFQCPFCSRAVPIIAALLEQHPNEVRIVFRHNPLSFHRHAPDAARATEEARAQGGDEAFWRMHDRLFANQDALTRDDLAGHASALGLDAERMARALDSDAHVERLAQDREIAVRFGARSTPMFYLNGRLLQGAQPLEVFEAVFEEARERARAARARGASGSGTYAAVIAGGAQEAVWVEPSPPR
jgi:protein-disulfide isomerase